MYMCNTREAAITIATAKGERERETEKKARRTENFSQQIEN